MSNLTNLSLLILIGQFITGCTSVKYLVDPQPTVSLQHHEYSQPQKIINGDAKYYFPNLKNNGNKGDLELLQTQAPIIVQGVRADSEATYEEEADYIGRPELYTDNQQKLHVRINPNQPVVYARVEKEKIKGVELNQLVYAYWYPRHPVGGIQKGNVDGGVLRITMDAGGRPAIYEHSHSNAIITLDSTCCSNTRKTPWGNLRKKS